MRVGLIDVDGHNFPNLALMKISAFCKKMVGMLNVTNRCFPVNNTAAYT